MENDIYQGTANLETGERVTTTGTLQAVAKWADNLISSYGIYEISIRLLNDLNK